MAVSNYTEEIFLKLYELKVAEHWLTLYPCFLKIMGSLKGNKILDLGCGNGEFTDYLASHGAKVIGADKSQKWIDYCKDRYKGNKNLKFIQADGVNLKSLKSGKFDSIIMNMVLLNVETESEIQKIFKECKRVLRPDGSLIFTDLNPIMVMTPKVAVREQKYSKNFSYFKNGSQFTAVLHLPGDKKIEFIDKHWTLEFYTKCLEKAGLYLSLIVEPNYGKNAPKRFKGYNIPEYIAFQCKKLN